MSRGIRSNLGISEELESEGIAAGTGGNTPVAMPWDVIAALRTAGTGVASGA